LNSSAENQRTKSYARSRAMHRLAALRRVGSPIWAPAPENTPQQMALESEADETLFGGSAGCGKSDLLLGLGLTQQKKGIVFRKQKLDASALIERAGEICGDYGTWAAKDRAYVTQDGRKLEFGHVSRPGDEQAQQGKAKDYYGFDELAHFNEHEYVFITTWLRSADPNQRCRIVSASNPPLTAQGFWMIKRWGPWLDKTHPNPAKSGELRWFATINGKDTEVAGPEPFEYTNDDGEIELIKPLSRTFISATLDDNPYYRNTGYKAVLQALPEPMRSALLHGKFMAAMTDDAMQVIPSAWIEAAMNRWEPDGGRDIPMSTLGCDIAMGGPAKTVRSARHGHWFAEQMVTDGAETPTGAAAAGLIASEVRDGAPIQIDTIGVGAAAFEQLDGLGAHVVSMDAREATEERDRSQALRFYNCRAWWWWGMRETLDPDLGDNISLPPDPELKADLSAPTWSPTPRGIKIEMKEEVEARLGRPVDKGDACVMANPQIELPRGVSSPRGGPKHAPMPDNDYDPHNF